MNEHKRKSWTKDELISKLLEYNNKYGYPTVRKFNDADGFPGTTTYRYHFGTWANALIEAGLKEKPSDGSNELKPKYGGDELIQAMIKFNSENGFPKSRSFNSKNGYPSAKSYIQEFGSWENAMLESGIPIPNDKKHLFGRLEYTKEQLLECLKAIVDKCVKEGRYLYTNDELDNDKNMPSSSVYTRNFGGLSNAYEEIGINQEEYNKNILIKDMELRYKELKDMLGRPPHSRDFDYYSKQDIKYYSAKAYTNNFGSIKDLQIHMGDKPTNWASTLTDDELLEFLIQFKNKNGREPSKLDMNSKYGYPHADIYAKRFGSFKDAKILAGVKSDRIRDRLITPNGNMALSGYEYKFLRMLEVFNVPFKKEELYSTYIKDFDKKYRFDFIVKVDKEEYFIEIFGITGNEDYDKKSEIKMKLCEDNNIPLIPIYKEDILHITFDEMYENLKNKIEDLKLKNKG